MLSVVNTFSHGRNPKLSVVHVLSHSRSPHLLVAHGRDPQLSLVQTPSHRRNPLPTGVKASSQAGSPQLSVVHALSHGRNLQPILKERRAAEFGLAKAHSSREQEVPIARTDATLARRENGTEQEAVVSMPAMKDGRVLVDELRHRHLDLRVVTAAGRLCPVYTAYRHCQHTIKATINTY